MPGVLVIKHGALGDVVLALGAMAAIRTRHPGERLVLLTTAPYVPLVEPAGWFDAIRVDGRAGLGRPGELLALRRSLAREAFRMVYDLQGSSRTGWYRRLWSGPRPSWYGPLPQNGALHARVRLERQLAAAGIAAVPPPSVDFLQADIGSFGFGPEFALLVPGGARRRPEKRWPAAGWAALARHLLGRGITPALIGAGAEAETVEAIAAATPGAVSLCARTSFAEIAALGRAARFAVGNDTGPMHLLAAAGCPVLTLFSAASDPARSSPGWPEGRWLRRQPLDALAAEEVVAALPQTP
ncbi:MAG TPA: glycosyltransferase family 9 protein [Geminicoccaceae bacterium]|nr:glycosyltransferase family 9 protein [Geminicoccaceae bacterium]